MNTRTRFAGTTRVLPFAAGLLLIPLLQACGQGGDVEPPPVFVESARTPSTTADGGALVTERTMSSDSLQIMSVGGPEPFLADSDRRAVYMLEGDADGSGCLEACLQQWAPLYRPSGRLDPGEGLAPALMGIITRPDGTEQMSYNGHPLYHYAGDQARGDTRGHGIESEWGHWTLVTPQGQPVGEPVATPPVPDDAGASD